MNKALKKSPIMLSIGLAAILSACVTINIYFPAAAAEKAADKIIDEVWQLKQGQEGAKPDVKPVAKPGADTPATVPSK
ncbi:MAG: hypothetical protein H7Z20_07865 [Bdellovibrio sp.]|nr:hypothetical protein [Methylotenera sp.]